MTKTREDHSADTLRAFYDRLKKTETAAQRRGIFKEMGTSAQAAGQWFRAMKLPPLGPLASTAGTKKKRGRPPQKATAKTSTAKKKRGRPKGSKNIPRVAVGEATRSDSGLSLEAKEMLIRLLGRLLS